MRLRGPLHEILQPVLSPHGLSVNSVDSVDLQSVYIKEAKLTFTLAQLNSATQPVLKFQHGLKKWSCERIS